MFFGSNITLTKNGRRYVSHDSTLDKPVKVKGLLAEPDASCYFSAGVAAVSLRH